MSEQRWLARYSVVALVVVGGLEWLLNRTVSRVAAAPPLEGVPRAIIEALGRVGYFVVSPAFLVAALVGWLAVIALANEAIRNGRMARAALSFFLAGLFSIAIVHLILGPQTWLNATLNILSLLAFWWLALLFILDQRATLLAKLSISLIALAYTGSATYTLVQILGNGTEPLGNYSVDARDVGELVALAVPYVVFAASALPGRTWRRARLWLVPVALGIVYSGGSMMDAITNKGYTDVFTTWSLGFYGVWPWPLYSVALALFTFSVIVCFKSGQPSSGFANPNTGVGLLILLFAGYNLQLPYQHLLAVLSLMLLTGTFRPLNEVQGSRFKVKGSGELTLNLEP